MWVAFEKLVKIRPDVEPGRYFNDKNACVRDMNDKIHLVLSCRPDTSPNAFMKSPGPFSNPKTPIQQYHETFKENQANTIEEAD
jgi:hypothetical protein